MKINYLYFSLIGLLFTGCVISNSALNDSNKPKNTKLVSIAQPANLLRTKYLDNGQSFRIYASFLANDSLDAETFKVKYAGSYSYLFDYATKDKAEVRVITINLDAISTKNRLVNFYFDLPKPKTDLSQYLVKIELSERGSTLKLTNELTLRPNSLRTADAFGIFSSGGDQILLNNFVNFQDSVTIKSLDEKEQRFTVVRYKHDFDAALSPLAVGQKPTPKPLFVDSLYEVNSNTKFILGQEALYYFIKDTVDRTGFSVLGVDDRYPKFTKPNQLTKPLVYLTTNQEFSNLNASGEYKKAFDQFWLTLYNGNQNVAKKTIKLLYRKIEEANTLFSTYKEGWKTDKGMVYVVMGRPDNIRFLKDKEVWVYTKNSKFSEINFTFNKRPNQFIEDHFELSRFSEFQPIWFPAVESWRVGENL